MEITTGILFIALTSILLALNLEPTGRGNASAHRMRWQRGAVTVTYDSPHSVQGTTTGPTEAQIANQINEVVATIVKGADADTAATVTHNMGHNAAQLALGRPWVILEPLHSFDLANLPAWTITTKTAVVITLTARATVGSGNAAPQLRTIILRPPAGAFSLRGIPGAA